MSRDHVVPAVQRKRTKRDLDNAAYLRPRDIFDLHGVPSSTLHEWCTREIDRLPSSLITGRCGRRGIRLVKRQDMDAFIEKFRAIT